ncbi:hypothetical protein BDA96_02G300400 [Sorghum bicolor]|uniref:Uncharacterized protein n=2 Tax=Sorghum bicolor TaxID=4558 RepID=A0A921RQI5_SORBI|nr:hypothetical protein BDA96_02G300400 [Sorghum bicolor]OQU89867.1 hypothetical protein SORBI_3002G285375 [Sorghum bicolor]
MERTRAQVSEDLAGNEELAHGPSQPRQVGSLACARATPPPWWWCPSTPPGRRPASRVSYPDGGHTHPRWRPPPLPVTLSPTHCGALLYPHPLHSLEARSTRGYDGSGYSLTWRARVNSPSPPRPSTPPHGSRQQGWPLHHRRQQHVPTMTPPTPRDGGSTTRTLTIAKRAGSQRPEMEKTERREVV